MKHFEIEDFIARDNGQSHFSLVVMMIHAMIQLNLSLFKIEIQFTRIAETVFL